MDKTSGAYSICSYVPHAERDLDLPDEAHGTCLTWATCGLSPRQSTLTTKGLPFLSASSVM
jgi:hypothetical protein